MRIKDDFCRYIILVLFLCFSQFTNLAHANNDQCLPDELQRLDVISAGYPRAFYFRIPEVFVRKKNVDFETWESMFDDNGGMIGEIFDEVVPGTTERHPDFFTRFKKLHPNQIVLVHYNGNARDPREEGSEAFFDGHWLYFNGCKVTSDLPAEQGKATLQVEDPDLFKMNYGRFKNKGEDLGICLLDEDGKVDWSCAEQLELLAIDHESKTLTVRRGAFGSTARNWQANKAYIAAHISEGPWEKPADHLMWFYNFSTTCPNDRNGRNCNNILAEIIAKRFNYGIAKHLDGLEFDVMHWVTWPVIGKRGADCDADGKADGGFVGGTNVYGIGMVEFCRELRELMNDDKLIMADGNYEEFQRSFGFLNGIESEGWPNAYDYNFRCFSSGINRHRFWNSRSAKPSFSYVNEKFKYPPWWAAKGKTGGHLPHQPSRTRLVLASCQMMDAVYSTGTWPKTEKSFKIPNYGEIHAPDIYDELNMGSGNRLNWLGEPLSATKIPAFKTPDIFEGKGDTFDKSFVDEIKTDTGVSIDKTTTGQLIVKCIGKNRKFFRWEFPKINLLKNDITLKFRVRGDAMKNYSSSVARQMYVSAVPPGWLMYHHPEQLGLIDTSYQVSEFDPSTGVRFKYLGNTSRYEQSHTAYKLGIPSDGRAVFWKEKIIVPPKANLKFWTSLLKETSEPITFSIIVRNGNSYETIFKGTTNGIRWEENSVDMTRWAGQNIEILFAASSKKNICEILWGDVHISTDSSRNMVTEFSSAPLLTHVDTEWFEPWFYFRQVGPGVVSIVFEMESTGPVYLEEIQAYAHPCVMYREFENGLVLANPSNESYAFDVSSICPGEKFRRIAGRIDQDVNNGQPVADIVKVPPRDGLFLVKIK